MLIPVRFHGNIEIKHSFKVVLTILLVCCASLLYCDSTAYSHQKSEAKQRLLAKHARVNHYVFDTMKTPYITTLCSPYLDGNLHAGHAMTYTLQDISARFQRLKGQGVLFVPSYDTGYPFIAAVEKQELQSRDRMEKAEFITSCFAAADHMERCIEEDLSSLGISCDWTQQTYYFNPEANAKVQAAFVELYGQGVLSQREEEVLWDPQLSTVLSEVKPMKGVSLPPRLEHKRMRQWFLNMKRLNKPLITYIKNKKVNFVPVKWNKTTLAAIKENNEWCISRQYQFGVPVPAWYGPDSKVFVAMDEEGAKKQALSFYGKPVVLTASDEVLDSAFSIGALGIIDPKYNVTVDLYSTGRDVLPGLLTKHLALDAYLHSRPPAKNIYVNPLIFDDQGAKMSSSKGNIVPVSDMVRLYGADSVRIALASVSAKDSNIRSIDFKKYSNVVNNLWTGVNFCINHRCEDGAFNPQNCKQIANKQVVESVIRLNQSIQDNIRGFFYARAAGDLVHFINSTFVDKYIPRSKALLESDNKAIQHETCQTLNWLATQLTSLSNPFMPFVTEELWEKIGRPSHERLVVDYWLDSVDEYR